MRSALKSSEAVSESLGFILIATVLFISFAMIFAIGFPVYNNYVSDGHMQNIEKSFFLLAQNGNQVAQQKSMVTSSEMKMFGGTLAIRDAGTMNISYYSDQAGTNLIGTSGAFNLSTLEYSRNNDHVAYILGSVCRAGLQGSIMLRDPEVSSDSEMLLIPMINLYQSEASISGDTLTRISFMTPYYSKLYQTIVSPEPVTAPGVQNVTIEITGDYAPGLGGYFEERLGFTESTGPGGVLVLSRTYTPGIDLTLTKSDVSISVN